MNRIIVGAHYGLKDWLAQRITAIVMVLYTFYIGGALFCLDGSYGQLRDLFAGSLTRFFTFIFIVSVCYHAWIGVRDIWMDYVKPAGLRLMLHVLTLLALVGYAGWAVQILWRL